MKLVLKLGFILILSSFLFACNQADKDNRVAKSVDGNDTPVKVDKKTKKFTVGVFYFHGDRRCRTCKAVGKVAKETVAKNFAKSTDIVFKDINIDEEENEFLARNFKVTGSGLYITDFSGKDYKNITKFAFANAIENPETLEKKIIEIVTEKNK